MDKTPGQVAYEAYCGSFGWKSPKTNLTMPQWEEVKEEIRNAWEISASHLIAWYTSRS